MASSDGVAPLVALGFTELEARVYAHLVAQGAATGYRIAAGTGKPVANTYKAIESLERKGAVLVEDGATRIVRAVEPERVLDALARSHEGERKKAKSALRKAAKVEEDGRTYTVGSEEQAVQRARQMLAEAAVVALLRGSAELRALLSEDLSDAEGRGVDIAAFDGEGLVLAVDASQCLIAPDGLWTRNAAVARAVFDGLAAETALRELAAHVEDGRDRRSSSGHWRRGDGPRSRGRKVIPCGVRRSISASSACLRQQANVTEMNLLAKAAMHRRSPHGWGLPAAGGLFDGLHLSRRGGALAAGKDWAGGLGAGAAFFRDGDPADPGFRLALGEVGVEAGGRAVDEEDAVFLEEGSEGVLGGGRGARDAEFVRRARENDGLDRSRLFLEKVPEATVEGGEDGASGKGVLAENRALGSEVVSEPGSEVLPGQVFKNFRESGLGVH